MIHWFFYMADILKYSMIKFRIQWNHQSWRKCYLLYGALVKQVRISALLEGRWNGPGGELHGMDCWAGRNLAPSLSWASPLPQVSPTGCGVVCGVSTAHWPRSSKPATPAAMSHLETGRGSGGRAHHACHVASTCRHWACACLEWVDRDLMNNF